MISKSEAEVELDRLGVLVRSGHFVYTSGMHGSTYFHKDVLYQHTGLVSRLCRQIADTYISDDINVVIAPAVGGVVLAHAVASFLTWARERVYVVGTDPVSRLEQDVSREVLAAYAEKVEQGRPTLLLVISGRQIFAVGMPGTDAFVIRRGYEKIIPGKKVLVLEDVLNTGSTMRKVIDAVRALEGEVIGGGVVCNRGGITAADLGLPKLFSTLDWPQMAFAPAQCPLCQRGISITVGIGHGRKST